MTDPKRLSDQADLPPRLQAALRMLGQNTTPPEVVERVQRSLAGLPTAGVASGFPFGWGGVVSTVAVAVAVTATVAWMRVQRDDARAVPAVSTVARAAQVQSVEPEPKADSLLAIAGAQTIAPATSVASTASVAAVRADGPSGIVTSPPVLRQPTPIPVARPSTLRSAVPLERYARRAVATGVPVPVVAGEQRSELSASSVSVGPSGAAKEVASVPLTPMAAVSAEKVAERAPANDAPPRPVAPQAPAPEDEASLVYRAKRLARTDRAAAWTLIESHAQHFPNGALVEEREMLAIDVLRRMGRSEEAKERAARFIVRFPKSAYRSVVSRSSADPR